MLVLGELFQHIIFRPSTKTVAQLGQYASLPLTRSILEVDSASDWIRTKK